MLLINIYNPKGIPLINNLAHFLQTRLQHHTYSMVAIIGDFNLQHLLWNHQNYPTYNVETEDLIELITANGLNLLLTPSTIAFPCTGLILDLVWGNEQMEKRILKCKVAHSHNYGSDHLPIITVLRPGIKPSKPSR